MTQQSNEIRGYVLSLELIKATLDYLNTQPFGQVATIVNGIVGQIQAQEKAAKERKQPPVESPEVEEAIKKAMETVKASNVTSIKKEKKK